MSDLDEEGGLLADDATRTLEEKEARAMASTTALRRDLAPVVSVRVVQETGGRTQQVIRPNFGFHFVIKLIGKKLRRGVAWITKASFCFTPSQKQSGLLISS